MSETEWQKPGKGREGKEMGKAMKWEMQGNGKGMETRKGGWERHGNEKDREMEKAGK